MIYMFNQSDTLLFEDIFDNLDVCALKYMNLILPIFYQHLV